MKVETELTKEAFRLAHGRFQLAHASSDLQTWYASLTETLMWVCVLDEDYRKEYGSKYVSFRDNSPYARELSGLRWARNRSTHQITLLLTDPATGTPFSPSFEPQSSLRFDQLVWRRVDELPEPEEPFRHKGYVNGKACYVNELQGQAVRYSLRRMNYFFIRPKGGLEMGMQAR